MNDNKPSENTSENLTAAVYDSDPNEDIYFVEVKNENGYVIATGFASGKGGGK